MSRIIDLRGKKGLFETNPVGQTADGRSIRTFGLWSHTTVNVGDYVVRPQEGEFSILQITIVDSTVFTGSNGDKFWKGTMEGVAPETVRELHPVVWQWLDSIGMPVKQQERPSE